MDDILIRSSRLLLRRPAEGDRHTLQRIFCDPGMMRYLGAPWTPEQVAEVCAEWHADWGVEQCWSGVLVKKATLEVIGTAGLTRDTLTGETGFELSWFVLPEHQKQGFATEITAELLRFAFTVLGAERLVAETHPENPASNRVLEKLDFTCLGERHHNYDDLPGFDTQVLWEFVPGCWQHKNMANIQKILARIPAWQGQEKIEVEQIAGLTNRNYRVTVDRERFVLRVSGQNTARLGINRAYELAALRSAAAAGLGPQVVAFLPPEGHLMTRWVAGRHWEVPEYRTPEHVRLLTETVKRIHALPANGAVFSPFQRVNSFLETARSFNVPLPHGFASYLNTMHAIEADQQNDPSDWHRMCHNDLVAVNYLYIEKVESIVVLDWEFSGLGDIYYDLATVVYTHDSDGPIPPELEMEMLKCYFGSVTALQRRRLLGMKYMLMLFTGLWGLAQHGMQTAGLIPAAEGFDYLEFAEYLFAHDIRELQAQCDLRLGGMNG